MAPGVVQALKDSFAHFCNAVLALKEEDADKPQKTFNRRATLRGSFKITYARVNGVPPRAEGFNQAPQKPAEKPKP
jgi:hypothetical protein